jgi:hypothetical protein
LSPRAIGAGVCDENVDRRLDLPAAARNASSSRVSKKRMRPRAPDGDSAAASLSCAAGSRTLAVTRSPRAAS